MTCIVIEHLCKRASQAGAEAIRSLNRPAFICLYERILPEASEAKHLHSKVKQSCWRYARLLRTSLLNLPECV